MSEKRLIDANALSKRLKDLDDWCGDLRKPGIEQARCMVHDAPTVAAEPVRHGRWNTLYIYLHICSECNVESEDRSRYCAYCGARMDAKEDAE